MGQPSAASASIWRRLVSRINPWNGHGREFHAALRMAADLLVAGRLSRPHRFRFPSEQLNTRINSALLPDTSETPIYGEHHYDQRDKQQLLLTVT
jgi:hypothetical protein